MSHTIAFFGATGDCAGYCLAAALKSTSPTYHCRALARTPEKLLKSLLAKGVTQDVLDRRLHIVQGDVKDIEAAKRTLTLDGSTSGRNVVDKIVSGIGGALKLQASLLTPITITDETICQDAGTTLLAALQQLQPSGSKPFFINISSTGLPAANAPRDVPFTMIPVYRWGLHKMHADKRVLQERLVAHANLPESQRVLSGYVNVKPSHLTDGPAKGLAALRVGTDENPAKGYSISRSDVGGFMFERMIAQDMDVNWVGKGVSVTY
nr:hypothetical protein CFP56_25815 [Quercus suber]